MIISLTRLSPANQLDSSSHTPSSMLAGLLLATLAVAGAYTPGYVKLLLQLRVLPALSSCPASLPAGQSLRNELCR